MSETIIASLLGGFFGVVIAGFPFLVAARRTPSRRVSDTASIVDASGKVIATLREEIDRLDGELGETRKEAKRMRDELRERPTKAELKEHIDLLKTQLEQLGQKPVVP